MIALSLGGLRIPPKSLLLFEMLINAVHKSAPNAFIAFNTKPDDTGAAAALLNIAPVQRNHQPGYGARFRWRQHEMYVIDHLHIGTQLTPGGFDRFA